VQGFLNLNNHPGFTSHDCVAKVRRLLNLKRVGHAGTLDPAATGVLPIALGRATRLLQFLPQDKAYQATIRFGIRTTTDDLEGEILLAQPISALTLESIQASLDQFRGVIQQVPPNYSAVQMQGKRLYDLARKGATIVAQARTVEVFSLEVLDWRPGEFPEVDLAIACGAGTYIRAIARDLGKLLQTGGTLAVLLRTMSSGFNLADSLTLEELETKTQAGTFQPIPPDAPLNHLPVISLEASVARRWCQGQKIGLDQASFPIRNVKPLTASSSSALRVHHENGNFLGIGQPVESETSTVLAPQVVFESTGLD
jgi:tRNA pseudouridine55 synthase